jgi:hypothetical protein
MSTGAATDVFALSRDEPAPADKALIRQKIKKLQFFQCVNHSFTGLAQILAYQVMSW